MKPFSVADDVGLKWKAPTLLVGDQRWRQIMLAMITFLYRQLCKARVVEMRAAHLGRAI
jgi:hypothetical protein